MLRNIIVTTISAFIAKTLPFYVGTQLLANNQLLAIADRAVFYKLHQVQSQLRKKITENTN